MAHFSETITVPTSPAAAYALIADLPNHGQFSADDLEIMENKDGTFTSTARVKGKTFRATLTDVEGTAPESFSFTANDATGTYRHTFTLSLSTGGTTVSRRVEPLQLTPAQGMLYWVALLPVRKPALRSSMGQLRDLLAGG